MPTSEDIHEDYAAININRESTGESLNNNELRDEYRAKSESERNIISMIKESMLIDKEKDSLIINMLKEQIDFLKHELSQRNHTIDCLLATLEESVKSKSFIKEFNKSNSGINIRSVDLLKDDDSSLITTQSSNNDGFDSKKLDTRNVTVRKIRKNARANNANDTTDNAIQGTVPLSIEIVGDSMLNNINSRGISKTHKINVLNVSGLKSDDIRDHLNPSIRRKPDAIICHVGTNDIAENIDTAKNLQEVINKIKKKSAHTRIGISSIFTRTDIPNIGEKVQALNAKLKTLCDDNLVSYIENANIDEMCLGKRKLHPNKKGKAFFAKNLIDFIDTLK